MTFIYKILSKLSLGQQIEKSDGESDIPLPVGVSSLQTDPRWGDGA
jgi:hypothetical protein